MRLLGRYLAVASFLAVMLGVTFALQGRQVARIGARGEAAQAEAVARAQSIIEAEVGRLEDDLMRRAEALAERAVVRRALRGDTAAQAAAVEAFAALRLPEGYAAELYTPTPELMAWSGPSMPLDPATLTTRFLTSPQTAVASDADLRQALVVWLPIHEDGRVLGAVRALRIVRARVPVRNEYLRDVDLAERWRARAGIPLDVQFGAPGGVDGTAYTVHGRDGSVLAVARIPEPPTALLQASAHRAYDDVLAFWAVLLLGWGVVGFWLVQGVLVRRAMRLRTARAWGAGGAAVVGASAVWVGARYGLLALDVPARWFGGTEGAPGENPAAALFDPVHLASGVGAGVLGSVGELVITALFAAALGVGWLRFSVVVLRYAWGDERARGALDRPGAGWFARALAAAAVGVAVAGAAALLVRRATLDATLPYFDRTGPLPEGMVLLVFGALLLLVLAALVVVRQIIPHQLAQVIAIAVDHQMLPVAEPLTHAGPVVDQRALHRHFSKALDKATALARQRKRARENERMVEWVCVEREPGQVCACRAKEYAACVSTNRV